MERGREKADRGGGATIRKPQLLCVRGTHPWCALQALHYWGSQMIALSKTTGWAARLWPPQTAWLRTNSRQQKKCPTYDFFFFALPLHISKKSAHFCANNVSKHADNLFHLGHSRSKQTCLQGMRRNTTGMSIMHWNSLISWLHQIQSTIQFRHVVRHAYVCFLYCYSPV